MPEASRHDGRGMAKVITRCLSGVQGACDLWGSIQGRWYIAGALLLSAIFTGPRKFVMDRIENVNALFNLPDHLWGKWLVILLGFGLIGYGILRDTRSHAIKKSATVTATNQALELPTLIAILGATSTELAGLSAEIARERARYEPYLEKVLPWIEGPPFEKLAGEPPPGIPISGEPFEVRAYPLLGLQPIERPKLTHNAGPKLRGDVRPKVIHDPADCPPEVKENAEQIAIYFGQLEGLKKTAEVKISQVCQAIDRKAQAHGQKFF